jgi:hypothetical protein
MSLSPTRHGAKITNLAIESLALHSETLRDLHLTCCYQCTDEAILGLAARRGSTLRSISLSRCGKISDQAIIGLASGATELQSINLHGCNRLTNAAILVRRSRKAFFLKLSSVSRI